METIPSSLISPAKDSVLAFMNLLYPRRCVACQSDIVYNGGSALCGTCRSKIKILIDPLCLNCGQDVPEGGVRCRTCKKESYYFESARAFGAFEGPLKEMIHHFKYRGKDYLSGELARMLVQCWAVNKLFHDIEGIVPVPPHSARLRERGYDHTLLLAESFLKNMSARSLNASFKPMILYDRQFTRSKKTPTQTSLTRESRKTNVSDAFLWKGKTAICNKKILLIDDVCTTCATLNECAKVLKNAGAREVVCLTIARD